MNKLLSHVKEQYFFEAERRDKLNSSSTYAIGIATISGSIAASTFANISFPLNSWENSAVFFTGVWLLCVSFFIFHVVEFFFGSVYKYVANANDVKNHFAELKAYFAEHPNNDAHEEAFDDFLLDTFARSATVNCENNDRKSKRLYLMNQWVMLSLIPSVAAGVTIGLSTKFDSSEPQRIMIVADDKPKSPTPAPSPRPTPPPERSIKDGANNPIPKKH